MKLIAAVSESWGIGQDNDLLYNIPADMKFFKEQTKDGIVIMGRKTLENIGHPLPGRQLNVILTSQLGLKETFASDENVLETNFETCLKLFATTDAWCIGGEQIYKLFLDYCDKAYITKIYDDKPANKFFPNLTEMPNWKVEWLTPIHTYNDLKYQHFIYKNTQPKIWKQQI